MGEAQFLGSVPKRSIFPWSWSNDGKTLVFLEYTMYGGFDIGSVSIKGDKKWGPLLEGKNVELQPQVSPDGRWLAYVSGEPGRQEVYVRPFPEVNKGWWQVSTDGGNSPLWSPDGRELFYRNGNSVIAVSLQTEPTFKKLDSKILFRDGYVSSDIRPGAINPNPWDISPDGKRFLMMKSSHPLSSSAEIPRKIEVVINWFAQLKQLVPAR
jgi:Tol biopolymer transport system component